MLTLAQYTALWGIFGPIVLNRPLATPTHSMPNYNDYVSREMMLEDYLDIFRSHNTRTHRGEPPGFVYGWEHPLITIEKDGIIMPVAPPRIRFVVIAEAPPIALGNYVYNPNGKATSYLTAVYNALYPGGPSISKAHMLIMLALKGVLLLDLFPFAMKYSTTMRKRLIRGRITLDYFNNPANPYSIHSRIAHFYTEGIIQDGGARGCFIAPPIVSHHLATSVNGGVAIPHLYFYLGPTITCGYGVPGVACPLIPVLHIPALPIPTTIALIPPYPPVIIPANTVFPAYACCGYNGANVPSDRFIRISLLRI